jgi:protein-disulfide isomerase
MDFPLAMHLDAQKASEAGLCAGDQGKFWKMHDKLFENSKALGTEDLLKYAEAIGLDVTSFKECLDGGKHDEEIKKRMAEGRKAGVTGTPAFLIGYSEDSGKVKAVKILRGTHPFSSFKTAIDGLLSPKKK